MSLLRAAFPNPLSLLAPGLAAGIFLADLALTADSASPVSLATHLIAPALFVWALYEGACLIGGAHAAKQFGPATVAGLRRAAAAVLLGVFTSVVLAPSLLHLHSNDFTAMSGVEFSYSIEAFTLVMVGFLLLYLARIGAALQADLESIL
jgi:hypothetical protein